MEHFLPIQGCESEITSMVTEARRKSSQCLGAALLTLGHLAAMTGMPLNVGERGAQATGKVTLTLIPQQLLSMSKLWGSTAIKLPLHDTGEGNVSSAYVRVRYTLGGVWGGQIIDWNKDPVGSSAVASHYV